MTSPAVSTVPPGRDYAPLLWLSRLVDVFISGGSTQEWMRETFKSVAAGFAAEKALILIPITPDQPGAGVRFEILAATPQIAPSHLAAIRTGKSAEGISDSILKQAFTTRQPWLVEHPLFLAGPFHSAMCAPVLDSKRLEVRALYYLQNTAPDITTAYRRGDLKALIVLTELVGRLYTFEPSVRLLTGYPGLSLPEMRNKFTEHMVRQRIAEHRGSYKNLATSLGLSRSNLYRLLDTYGLHRESK